MDKAQIFTSSKGDHFRSRMTHTIEVCQIARTIGEKLNLNIDLIEVTALAHDIGHTPFGHQGERTLNEQIKSSNDCDSLKHGGFKHNYHALRVLTFLEESSTEYEGLNISYQVLEGILKHTKTKKDEYDITCFLKNGDEKYLYLEFDEPITLEGQVVKIAGESNLLKSMISNEIVEYFIENVCEQTKNNMEEFDEENEFYKANHGFNKKVVELTEEGVFLLSYLEQIINKRVINSSEVATFDSKSSKIIRGLFAEFYENPMKLPDATLNRIYLEMRNKNLSTKYIRLYCGYD